MGDRGPPRSKFLQRDDEKLKAVVQHFITEFGHDGVDWKRVGEIVGKTRRQCRERYKKYLSPDIYKGRWTPEEDELLLQKVESLGCHWVAMVRYFPGRTDVILKNRWNLIKKAQTAAEDQPVEANPTPAGPFEISVTTHEFIDNDDAQPQIDWFDVLFTDKAVAAFMSEKGNWRVTER